MSRAKHKASKASNHRGEARTRARKAVPLRKVQGEPSATRHGELLALLKAQFPKAGKEERVKRALAALELLRLPFNLSAQAWEEISQADVYDS